jgi:hypothetical protein
MLVIMMMVFVGVLAVVGHYQRRIVALTSL